MGGLESYKPVMTMIAIQFGYVGLTLFGRAAFQEGLSPRIFVVYRQLVATLIIIPVTCFSRRGASHRTSIGLRGFAWIFLATFIGVTANQNFYFEGLYLSSSSITTAMGNLIPAVTFVMATIVGFERVSFRSLKSVAKIAGTAFCVGGAISMATLKGPELLNMCLDLPKRSIFGLRGENRLLGCLFLFGNNSCWSLWLILQVPVSANCPDHFLSTLWMCSLGTFQTAVVALILEPGLEPWKLTTVLEYIACLFVGLATALTIVGQAWCVSKKGPVFSAMFNPLCTVIVTIVSAIFLDEEVYLGGLLGATTVIIGLYVVLWGKTEDYKEIKQDQYKDPKSQNDQATSVVVRVDLEEPLLSEKSAV